MARASHWWRGNWFFASWFRTDWLTGATPAVSTAVPLAAIGVDPTRLEARGAGGGDRLAAVGVDPTPLEAPGVDPTPLAAKGVDPTFIEVKAPHTTPGD